MSDVTPFLMFSEGARGAAEFYVSVFPDSRMLEGHGAGVSSELKGQRSDAFDGGEHFSFSEGISFVISCETQAEVDHYWERLTGGGGQESMCGWLKDRYGVSWQVIPVALKRLLSDPDPGRAQRAAQAMLQMRKIDIAALEAAADG